MVGEPHSRCNNIITNLPLLCAWIQHRHLHLQIQLIVRANNQLILHLHGTQCFSQDTCTGSCIIELHFYQFKVNIEFKKYRFINLHDFFLFFFFELKREIFVKYIQKTQENALTILYCLLIYVHRILSELFRISNLFDQSNSRDEVKL